MNNKKELIIFGTGEYYIRLEKVLKEKFNIVAFIDNNTKKQNTLLDGIKVISPNEIEMYAYDKIFIASSYEVEIENQLLGMGIKKQSIITAENVLSYWMENGKIDFYGKYKELEKDKINVAFCINELTSGGAQRVLIDLLNNLDYSKYAVDLIVIYNKGLYFDEINKNVKCITLFTSYDEMLVGQNYIKKSSNEDLYKLFINKKYDVEIAFIEGEVTKIISGSNNKDSKKLAWVHTNMKNNHWCENFYSGIKEEEECYRKFNYIVCDSYDVKTSMFSMFNISRKNIKVIHTVIESKKIEKLSIEENIKFDNFTFCAVGRLSKVKGIDRLIRVHKKLIDENLSHHIIVIGEGEEEKTLKELVEKLDVKDTFKFLGFKNNPYKYVKASDVFILPSLEEGLSTVVCEALVLGKTIIATKCSGILELLEDSKYGIVAENSEKGIYNSMKEVLLNRKMLVYYSEKAQIRMKDFSKEDIINQIEEIIYK